MLFLVSELILRESDKTESFDMGRARRHCTGKQVCVPLRSTTSRNMMPHPFAVCEVSQRRQRLLLAVQSRHNQNMCAIRGQQRACFSSPHRGWHGGSVWVALTWTSKSQSGYSASGRIVGSVPSGASGGRKIACGSGPGNPQDSERAFPYVDRDRRRCLFLCGCAGTRKPFVSARTESQTPKRPERTTHLSPPQAHPSLLSFWQAVWSPSV